MNIRAFSKFVYSQSEICSQLKEYAPGGVMTLGLLTGKSPDSLHIGIIGIMIMGMALYREWLLVHGIKGIQEVENKFKTDQTYIQ